MMNSNFYELQRLNEERLSHFLDFVDLALCKRCWRERNKQGKPYHHHGGMLQILEKANLDGSTIKAWAKDTTHGLCHGLMVAFFATYLSGQMDEFQTEINTNGSL